MEDPGVGASSLRLSRLRDEILLYLGGALTDEDAFALASASRGVVVKGAKGLRKARMLQQRGAADLVVHDPARYETQTGIPEVEQLSILGENETLERQRAASVGAYLSPSGFVPDGDVDSLAAVLTAGILQFEAATELDAVRPAFAVLPLAKHWLVDAHSRSTFIRTVRAAGVPIALVLADRNDPLGSHRAVAGLVDVLTSVDDVFLLRSDLSAIGAVAWGALSACIGTGTAVRHAVPPTMRAGGVPEDRSPSVLVPGLNAFYKGSLLERARIETSLLDCGCLACEGNTLRRFGDARFTVEAYRHNLYCWTDLAEHIFTVSPAERAIAWTSECQRAIDAIAELSLRTKIPFRVPAALRAWARLR